MQASQNEQETRVDYPSFAPANTKPQNPYASGLAADQWRLGFIDARKGAAPGSKAERFYNEGAAARKAYRPD